MTDISPAIRYVENKPDYVENKVDYVPQENKNGTSYYSK